MSLAAAWVGTSWKMNKDLAAARAYIDVLNEADWPSTTLVQPFVIPPTTALSAVRDRLLPHNPVLLGAQNVHWEDSGAWTGEVSVPQARDAGARLVEIGHSERREWFGETDHTVNLKVRATLRHGLIPLVCVGEPREIFEAGGSVDHVQHQVHAALRGVDKVAGLLVAYEPIWAIGEYGQAAAPDDVQDVFAALAGDWGSRGVRLLYGGSVSTSNAVDLLLGVPGLDGLFVGRAAWSPEGFLDLLDLTTRTVESRLPRH